MQFIREAGESEVLASSPGSPDALLAAPYSVWEFTPEDIEAVVTRLPDTTYDATLGDLGPAWRMYCKRDGEAKARQQRAFGLLTASGAFPHRPILYHPPEMKQYPCYIHDGRHRLFAALDFALARKDFTVEVFWSDEGSGRTR